MRAWLLDDAAGPGSFRLGEVPLPEPGSGEVRVRLVVSGINHLDLWISHGTPAPPTLPHVPGGDGAGVVDAVGPGVEGIEVGDEVVLNPTLSFVDGRAVILGEHAQGTLADFVLVPAANAVPKPKSLGWDKAGTFGLVTGTAWRMLRRGGLAKGSTVLVVGVGGGVSSAALELAVAHGADVWVTSRDQSKIDAAVDRGALGGFDSVSSFSKAVRAASDGGVDIVIENVGGATWDQSLRALRMGGRLVTCGSTAGNTVEINLAYLFFRQLQIIGSTMFGPADFAYVLGLAGDGRIEVPVDSVFSFDEFPAALARLAASGQSGKIAIGR